MKLILASSSPYRRELLERLKIPFEVITPEIDETPRSGEAPEQVVERLAIEKAEKVANQNPGALVIGSDQVAVYDEKIVGKPHNHDKAVEQLRSASGKTVTLYTGLALINAATRRVQCEVVPYRVTFRHLNEGQIESYLRQEQPYSCTGSVRSEGLGIALLEKFEGDDHNTLIGLPLIRLVRMLESEGIKII
ncbi:MAG: Maf family nucleotide pyrophosphatase [Gammaproteobacteria bacterium]|nr:Maf family nucleotide pyrophosphatase [Gammaproteobacteria bacterium]MDH3370425.1 Maf family nucleotide pyrophosphatase [Gammaproteobacteria bacterium]MDH3405924.1 Maf family nucleotide pyrophosphatase [Gammaproteobacteria bacterium]MDH3562168.1 Maf family nucleotide pyrophosphatase [Gammaproteobacteria bacterium]MDH5486266.1 Maf family nucleotide pyrophosphatase [Gammaproteobacteria bacterium]